MELLKPISPLNPTRRENCLRSVLYRLWVISSPIQPISFYPNAEYLRWAAALSFNRPNPVSGHSFDNLSTAAMGQILPIATYYLSVNKLQY